MILISFSEIDSSTGDFTNIQEIREWRNVIGGSVLEFDWLPEFIPVPGITCYDPETVASDFCASGLTSDASGLFPSRSALIDFSAAANISALNASVLAHHQSISVLNASVVQNSSQLSLLFGINEITEASTIVWDLAASHIGRFTLTNASTDLEVSNIAAGRAYNLLVIQASVGASLTFNASDFAFQKINDEVLSGSATLFTFISTSTQLIGTNLNNQTALYV